MSVTTHCPYCNAKLRVAEGRHRPNRVKCTVCKNYFHPSQVSLADGAQTLNEPLTTGEDESPEADRWTPRRARDDFARLEAPPTDDLDPPNDDSINPEVVKAAYPDELVARRESRRDGRGRGSKGRVKEDKSHQPREQSRFEIALAAILLGVGFLGLAGATWYFLRPSAHESTQDKSPPTETADVPPAPSKRVSALAEDFAPKPPPKRLIGTWELRNDDDRRGWIEFRADNSLSMRAWRGDVSQTPFNGNWFLIQDTGEELVFEIGPQRGQLGNRRYFIHLTGPDAFTLTHVQENSLKQREDLRYTRRVALP